MKIKRRSFLLTLPTLPLAVKAFAVPARSAMAEYQQLCPRPCGGSFMIGEHIFSFDVSAEEMQRALGKDSRVTKNGDHFTITYV